jgi:hypothetical protein
MLNFRATGLAEKTKKTQGDFSLPKPEIID